jgi:hypothetical protein
MFLTAKRVAIIQHILFNSFHLLAGLFAENNPVSFSVNFTALVYS